MLALRLATVHHARGLVVVVAEKTGLTTSEIGDHLSSADRAAVTFADALTRQVPPTTTDQ